MAQNTTPGRRRNDVPFGEIPNDLQPGDYWRYVDSDGNPKVAGGSLEVARSRGNLTGGVWGCCCPRGGVGTLMWHTVRENGDGTITVAPNDGSSNSILVQGGTSGSSWHGYIDHGTWSEI